MPRDFAAWVNIAGSGLPAASGTTPVAEVTAATMDPLPTIKPRSIGSDVSRFVARYFAPRCRLSAASDSSRHPVSGLCPCSTTLGASSALSTTR